MRRAHPIRPLNADAAVEMILEGHSYRSMAAYFGVSLSTMHRFLNDKKHPAYTRVRAAFMFSADLLDDRAMEILTNCPANPVALMRARELAAHCRWAASKRDPRRYGRNPVTTCEAADDFAEQLSEARKRCDAARVEAMRF